MKSTTISSRDGTPLNLAHWSSDEARATVLLVHGLAEHMGRYAHVAKHLNEAGFEVYGIELRGHGHSGGKRGHLENWDEYVADVRAALEEIGQDVFLVSHSMGGLVTASVALSNASGIRGFSMSNPLLGVRFDPPAWKVGASRLLNRLMPRLSLSNELDTAWLSRDPEVISAYEKDKLVYSTITPRWYHHMVAAQEKVNGSAANLRPLNYLFVFTRFVR